MSPGDRRDGGAAPGPAPAYLVRGDDPALLGEAVRELVRELVGDEAAGLAVEDLGDDVEIGAVIDACVTPPFLVERRVVVVRDAGRFRGDDTARLVAYLGDPLATTSLVLVGGGGQLSPSVSAAVRGVGRVVDASRPREGRARRQWVLDRLHDGPVRLDGAAAALVDEHLGEDLGRLGGLLDLLAASYGQGARVGVEEVEPFLGEAGGVAPWELTDAIDSGDTATALVALRRLLAGGQRHPLAVMGTLQRHYGDMLRLDGAEVSTETQAAELLGTKPYPAAKAMRQARKLGSAAIGRAITLLADADVDLRGRTGWPEELVLDVLVARLSRLAPPERQRGRGRR